MPVAVFAPAKINLFLAITGRRPDGFHSLVSLVAPLAWGDTLWIDARQEGKPVGAGDTLVCDDPTLPSDGTNLVLKASAAFRAAAGWNAPVRFTLQKRIPHGAGLGGGSSDAVAALRGLNALAPEPLDPQSLATLAAGIGSDCPLFLAGAPVLMRGRGERLHPLDAAPAQRLRGRRILLFKPAFGIATAWSYGRLAAGAPGSYVPEEVAERRLASWLDSADAAPESLLFNSMEPPAFEKHIALPSLLGLLKDDFGLRPAMSGSGSACFAFLPENLPAAPIIAAIRDAWGDTAFILETRLA